VAGVSSAPGADGLVLVIDVGLTNAKAVLFDLDGAVVRRQAVAYATRRPAPGRAEQDPEAWWQAAAGAVRGLAAPSGTLPGQVTAIGVTGHMHALACVDANLDPLGPALILGDRRATREAEAITAEVGADVVFETTGATMDASMPAAKIRWLQAHEPDRIASTRWFLGCKDQLRARLTGDVATEPVDACATSLYDIRSGAWSPAIADAARAPLRSLPPVRAPESIAGALLPGVASELGLPAGIPVIVGAGDDVEVLGNGLLASGSALEHLGTTGSILAVSGVPIWDPARALELYPHTVDGLWVLGGSMTAAGSALGWAARALGYPSVGDAAECLEAWPTSADAPVFVPHLEGSRSPDRDPLARGAWVGMHAAHERQDLMLSAFEGVALGLQAILARTESLAGGTGPITVSAGESADQRWLQVRADVYGRSLAVLDTTEPTALGLFTLVAGAIGVDESAAAASLRVVRVRRTVEPRQSSRRARRLAAYAAADAALRQVWPAITEAT
jgi:xylulokinase